MEAPISPKGISKDAQRCAAYACKLAAGGGAAASSADTSVRLAAPPAGPLRALGGRGS